jgi:hypothetical protein
MLNYTYLYFFAGSLMWLNPAPLPPPPQRREDSLCFEKEIMHIIEFKVIIVIIVRHRYNSNNSVIIIIIAITETDSDGN